MEYLTIEIPVRLWQRVDGCVDNSMATDVVDGVMRTVLAGACVRDAGWRASAACSGERDDFGWPCGEHPLVVTLRRAHWEWVVSQLVRWEPHVNSHAEDDLAVRAIISNALSA